MLTTRLALLAWLVALLPLLAAGRIGGLLRWRIALVALIGLIGLVHDKSPKPPAGHFDRFHDAGNHEVRGPLSTLGCPLREELSRDVLD